jgi:uncharacterized protein YecA (UPF0149 family)
MLPLVESYVLARHKERAMIPTQWIRHLSGKRDRHLVGKAGPEEFEKLRVALFAERGAGMRRKDFLFTATKYDRSDGLRKTC